jgi:urease accessory protein
MRDGPPDSPRSPVALPPELMIWLSPAFPVGAFAFSHGLELAVERGWVDGRAGLEAWLSDLVASGSLRTDLIVLAAAWRAETGDSSIFRCGSRDWASHADRKMELSPISSINDLALAMQPSAERRLETVTQGNAFLATVRAAWPHPRIAAARGSIGGDVAYPVAIGISAAAHAIPLAGTLLGFAIAFVSNLASAAIRLSVIGQTDGQRMLATLMPALSDAAAAAATATLEDLGSAVFRSDIASQQHETQYTRLFRS